MKLSKLNIVTLPLLMKELIELAAQKRTYILRAGYALMLFSGFCIYYYLRFIETQAMTVEIAGVGRLFFMFTFVAQLIGIGLFMPAIMSPAITQEKESDALLLLMMTDLKPWEILLQKYFGRMLPMLSFLLLSLPIMGFSYAYGGVGPALLFMGISLLFSSCLFVGAMSLMFSSFCQSTVWAFVLSYATILVFVVPCWGAIPLFTGMMIEEGTTPEALMIVFALVANGVTLVLTTVFLILARVFLVARATSSPMEQMEKTAERLRKAKAEAEQAQRIGRRTDLLPQNNPVSWREMKTGWMSKSVLLGVSGGIAAVLAFIMIIPLLVNQTSAGIQFAGGVLPIFLTMVLWLLGVLSLCVLASSTIGRERSNQTLETLLTTPMSGKEILSQKMSITKWFMLAVAIPLLVLFAIQTLVKLPMFNGYLENYMAALLSSGVYALNSFLMLVVYLPLVYWFCMWLGFKINAKGRAPMIAVLTLAIWAVTPYVVLFALDLADVMSLKHWLYNYLILTSPMSMMWMNEQGLAMVYIKDPTKASTVTAFVAQLLPVVINAAFYGGLALLFRHLCMFRVDKNLGRVWEGAGLSGQKVEEAVFTREEA